MRLRRFLAETRGAAAVEFALIVPLLVIILFVGSEAGHFVWTQHKLAEAVRDGARYASRLPIDNVCDGATDVLTNGDNAAAYDQVKLLTRTGQLANPSAPPVVPGWTDAQVTVTVSCQSFVDTGIYADLGAAGPMVTVSATGVTYPSLFNLLGGLPRAVQLTSRSSVPVIAI